MNWPRWATHSWDAVKACTPVSPGCLWCAWTLDRNSVEFADYEPHEMAKWPQGSRVAVSPNADFFHGSASLETLSRHVEVMRELRHLTFFVATKRPARALEFAQEVGPFPKNVWLGVSVENDKLCEYRVQRLLTVPCGGRFVEATPMLDALVTLNPREVDWVMCGGMSAPDAPMLPISRVEQLVMRCRVADTPFYWTGWGTPRVRPGVEFPTELPR